jgi:hypothetical protein
MHFFLPEMLWGLGALSIPIIIHFFNFRRLRKEGFSNVAFLKNIQTQSKSFMKLKHWLVLACRLFFVACVVLAFAQPFLGKLGALNTIGESFGVYLDNSFSTQNDLGGGSVLDAQITKAVSLAKGLNPNQKAVYITNDFAGIETKLLTPKGFGNQISKTSFSTRNRSLEDISNRFNELAVNEQSPLLVLADFQKSTLGSLKPWIEQVNRPTVLIPFQANTSANVLVDTVWLETPFIQKNVRNYVYIQLKNNGSQKANGITLTLNIDGIDIQSMPLSVEPNNSLIQKIAVNFSKNGLSKAKVSIYNKPLLFDNTYYFVLNTSPKVSVVHVAQSPQNEYIKNAFTNDSLFTYKSYSALSVNPEVFEKADLLILENVTTIDQSLLNGLANFKKMGGLLLLVPAANANVTSYNAAIQLYGSGSFSKSTDVQKSGLDQTNLKGAFFSDIFETTFSKAPVNMPNANLLYSWNTVGQEAILSTKGKRPFLSMKNTSKGSLAVMATSLNVSETDFGTNALFVPIMYKLAALSLRPQALANRLGSEASVFVPLKNVGKEDILKMSFGKEQVIPSQAIRADGVLMELPKAAEIDTPLSAGFYDISLNGTILKTLALNNATKESEMGCYTPAELKNLVKANENIKVLLPNELNDWQQEYAHGKNNQKPLWKYFVCLALLFLLAEILLIRMK